MQYSLIILYISFFKIERRKPDIYHGWFWTGVLLGRNTDQFLREINERFAIEFNESGAESHTVKILLLYNMGIIEAFIADFMMNSNDSWPIYANIWLGPYIAYPSGNLVNNYNCLTFIRLLRLIFFQKRLTISFENLFIIFPLILMGMKLYSLNI